MTNSVNMHLNLILPLTTWIYNLKYVSIILTKPNLSVNTYFQFQNKPNLSNFNYKYDEKIDYLQNWIFGMLDQLEEDDPGVLWPGEPQLYAGNSSYYFYEPKHKEIIIFLLFQRNCMYTNVFEFFGIRSYTDCKINNLLFLILLKWYI